jgi:lysozyme family protein
MFEKIMMFVIKEEVGRFWSTGGYTNDPVDAGGETKWGISKRANPTVDIKNLTLPQAMEIYKTKYWNPEWEKLGFPMAAVLLDTSVNMGKTRALDFLEKCNGSYIEYLQLRIARYLEIIAAKPNQVKYKNGWMNRVTHLRRFIDGENQQG